MARLLSRKKMSNIFTHTDLIRSLLSGNYTINTQDQFFLLKTSDGSATNITVPPNASVPIPIGFETRVMWYGVGQPTIVAGDGVTINTSLSSLAISERYASVVLEKISTNEWVLTGDKNSVAYTPPFTAYAAVLISSSPTANPTATVLLNTIGATITWSRTDTGIYIATASSAVFTANKTICFLSQGIPNTQSQAYATSTTQIELDQQDIFAGLAQDGLEGTTIEIRIYS